MMKKIPCLKCDGRGHISIVNENSISYYTCEECDGSGQVEAPMTNADRIRAMTDEELEKFIQTIKTRAVLCKAVKNNDAFNKLCSIEWLKQPAE